MTRQVLYFVILGMIPLVLCGSALGMYAAHRRGARRGVVNAGLVLVAAGFTLWAAEFLAWAFFAQSDGWGFTLAHKRFLDKYWGSVNAQGYRDTEHPADSFEGRRTLFVVGDSITAGSGVRDVRTGRYSNLIGDGLGPGWRVVNIAQSGWNMRDYERALRAYPYQKPDAIVLGYCLNDFEGALQDVGLPVQPDMIQAPYKSIQGRFYEPLVAHSHIINLVYWRVYRRSRFDIGDQYLQYIKDMYGDPRVWAAHSREMLAVRDYAARRRAPLVVAVFPALGDIPGSRGLTARLARFWRENGAIAVDLAPAFEGRSVKELTANPFDAHPSPAAHAIAAREILKHIPRE